MYEMLEYLNETYGGSKVNMLDNSAYYCYTIKDKNTNKYYSGSRGVEGRDTHDLLINYFTSSVVRDFKNNLKLFPEQYEFIIEYFNSRIEAFDAERKFHNKHNVGKNKMFINASNAGGTNCGAGTVLCRDKDGSIYRITVEEYATGNHVHVSTGFLNIRTEDGLKKISISDFDDEIHTTQFKDYVLAYDNTTKKNVKIPKEQFLSDDRYVGITSGKIVAKDKLTNKTVVLTEEEFKLNPEKYVGNTYGLVPVIEISTGEKKIIHKHEFDRQIYRHSNSGLLTVYSLEQKRNVKVSKEEYHTNIHRYANLSTKVFYRVDNIFFKSKDLLDEYYRKTRGKTVLKVSQYAMSEKFKDIEIISKEQYSNEN